MDQVKVALIGAGSFVNAKHLPCLSRFEDVQLVGVCELNGKRLSDTAARFNISRTFSSYQQMLDETQPDAVYAIMPPQFIFDVAMDVLARGTHLFVEKPPAVTTQQTAAMAAAAARHKCLTAVGFQRRYHPLVAHCHEHVKRHGPIQQVAVSYHKNRPPGPDYPYYRGAIDILHCDAIHAVDAMRFYAGLSEVTAVASNIRQLDAPYPVSFNALVHFANDAVGMLLVNWRTGRRFLKFEFHALGASAYADADGEAKVWTGNGAEPIFASTHTTFAGTKEAYRCQGFWEENRAFIDAIKTGRPLHNDLADAVKTMDLADRIYASSGNGGNGHRPARGFPWP